MNIWNFLIIVIINDKIFWNKHKFFFKRNFNFELDNDINKIIIIFEYYK